MFETQYVLVPQTGDISSDSSRRRSSAVARTQNLRLQCYGTSSSVTCCFSGTGTCSCHNFVSLMAASSLPELVFVDANGNHFIVKDVLAAGDCALLALLNHPNFNAPVSDCLELRRAIVSFAQGPCRDACFTVYGMVGDRSNMQFDCYLQHVLQPRFWVGTVFFIWASMAYGCDVRSHYFDEFRAPKYESTADFLVKYFKDYLKENMLIVDVFFHQYRNMGRCKPSMYNHFASLIRIPSNVDVSCAKVNEMVNAVGTPWWKKTEEVHGYDCSEKQPKPSIAKKNMNKEEKKKLSKALTYHYLKEQADGDDIANEMEMRLEQAVDKGCGPLSSKVLSENVNSKAVEKVTACRSLLSTFYNRTWLQRSNIIFLFLHPQVGNRNLNTTASLTGVNERTLSGWLTQKKMIEVWVDIVEDLTAEVALKALPHHLRDLFVNVDPDSKVTATRYRNRIANRSQLKLYYKGGKVSETFLTIYPF